MTTTPTLRGAITALVTPMNTDGSLDEATLVRMVERQIDAGINGLVPVGTTGESPTLSAEEDQRVIELTVEAVRGHDRAGPAKRKHQAEGVLEPRAERTAPADGETKGFASLFDAITANVARVLHGKWNSPN